MNLLSSQITAEGCSKAAIIILSLILVYHLRHGSVEQSSVIEYSGLMPDASDEISRKTEENVNSQNSQKFRLKNLQQNCQKYYNPYKAKVCSTSNFKNILNPIAVDCKKEGRETNTWWSYDWLADPVKKLAICMPPKAGCTTWQRFYQAIENLDSKFLNGTDADVIFNLTPRLSKFDNSGQYKFLKDDNEAVFKVLHSRHPFERLYSGWRDKFVNQKVIFMNLYGNQIKNFLIDDDWEDEKENSFNPAVPFVSFLRYINNTEMSKINNHFKPISFFCSPCEVNFTYISDMTTINSDMFNVFEKVVNRASNEDQNLNQNLPEIEFFEKIKDLGNKNLLKNLRPYSERSAVKDIYRKIDEREPGLVRGIYDRYKWDFVLMGYSVDGYMS